MLLDNDHKLGDEMNDGMSDDDLPLLVNTDTNIPFKNEARKKIRIIWLHVSVSFNLLLLGSIVYGWLCTAPCRGNLELKSFCESLTASQ